MGRNPTEGHGNPFGTRHGNLSEEPEDIGTLTELMSKICGTEWMNINIYIRYWIPTQF